MTVHCFTTGGGLEVEVNRLPVAPDEALLEIYELIDEQKGSVFSSGFDYPGRHSRWDIGFVNPALEVIGRGRSFEVSALNAQGEALLPIIAPGLHAHEHIATVQVDRTKILGEVHHPADFFTEEERSRQPSLFSVLRILRELFSSDADAAQHFGLYGAFGYDLVMHFEDIVQRHARDPQSADCHLFLPLDLVIVDRKREVASRFVYSIQTHDGPTARLDGGGRRYPLPAERALPGGAAGTINSDHAPGEFAEKVRKVLEGTACGDYFEVVLSQTFSTPFTDRPMALFRRLARINPSPYMFLLNFGSEQLIGASPELFVRITGKRYETCPIAGTVPRGATALEDADRALELMSSRKDESELTMCTDVDRNDMARVCVPGSVRVIGRRQLEFYSHLIHTVDHVEGYLRDEFDALDAFQTHMWACTVTGAPKPAAMQEIENLEASPRGWYSGAIGFLSFNGNLNTGITLRTAHIKDGMAYLRAGATLLYGSDPDLEEKETRTKAAAFLAALAVPHESAGAVPPDGGLAAEGTISGRGVAVVSRKRRILLIDYRDSFVHNLAAYLRELGTEVVTLRSGFPVEMLDRLTPDLVLLSPGPGTPEEFFVPEMVGTLADRRLPTFGVCLGHQGIGQHFGGTIAKLPIPEHGKASPVRHTGHPIFSGVSSPFEAGRYHSLYILSHTVPECLEVIAHTTRERIDAEPEVIPMAFRHRTLPIAGVQFHPESLMTLKNRAGHRILLNVIENLTADSR